ncbi:MAG TPA: protein YgfX [Gammaproteobacteria bacterium]|jgi:hypothetical protein|nr:protein YgfX [Gammaproteobacteria bacterium]
MQQETFQLHPSRYYTYFFSFFTISTMAVVCYFSCAVVIKLGLLLFTVFYSASIFKRHVFLKSPLSVRCITWRQGQLWRLSLQNTSVDAVLRGDSTVTRFVSVLRFSVQGSRWPVSCVVFPDALAVDKYRRLIRFMN